MNPVAQLKKVVPLFVVSFVFACFSLPSTALAVSPPPDGDYPGGNTAEGFNALLHLSPQDGGFNTAVGWCSLFWNVNGSLNTAVGAGALDLNTGHNNTGVGAAALLLNSTGTGNTATGALALVLNGTGDGNTANGGATLSSNITGAGNTAVGAKALFSNDGDPGQGQGSLNTAVGLEALTENTTGAFNTAVGAGVGPNFPAALGSNSTGTYNTAVGASTESGPAALGSNTTGGSNTAVGAAALKTNTTGSRNTAVGFSAGNQVTTASGVITIGALMAGEDVDDTTWIGGVYNTTTQSGTTAPVVVSDTGQLGTVASSKRFKKDVASMEKSSEAILSLRPVTFHYKTDAKGTPQFGLIAEEVAKVDPALVLPDKEGKPFTVRYDAINAMLLNEFLKEHKAFLKEQDKVAEQEATITQLKAELQATAARQQKQIEVLSAGLQKVNAQLQVRKATPRTVSNN